MGLDREYLVGGLENPRVSAYLSYQVDMAVLFGAERNRAEREMRDVLDFEIALANVRHDTLCPPNVVCVSVTA